MPRFVVLRHESPHGIHFDFMLEAGDALKTWALPQPPQPGLEMECKALADHRLAYLDYEGPISGGRGSVRCWDRGTYRIVEQSGVQWVLELAGEKLAGTATLRRPTAKPTRWLISLAEERRA